jgi:trehalose 6-phosphate synthase
MAQLLTRQETDRGAVGDPPRHRPLIVVSNREPYEHRRLKNQVVCQRTDGGLTSALDPVLRRLGGTWVAWGSGDADPDNTDEQGVVQVPPDSPAYRLRRVWLTSDEVKGGYLGYANEVLWPLCHITLDRIAYRKVSWEAYHRLNCRFADGVLEELRRQPGPVWVHDYHLSLLPRLIKDAMPHVHVSVFWHVPWPGPDVFRILPERRELLEGLLAADSISFQTGGYAKAFGDCAHQFLGAELSPTGETVLHQDQRTQLAARPISVDYRSFSARARTPAVEQAMAQVKRSLGWRRGIFIGLGVDRLDYTKGLLKRLWALDTFFSRYPDYRGCFTFVQIAIPTRNEVEAYRRYREVIRQTVFDINARHGTPECRPIEYREGRISLDTLVACYRLADLALVSSVYDGMNLVAKEYVASQVDAYGVLLVSQMAGAAEELKEAFIINPYDPELLADTMKQALEMAPEERHRRMQAMRQYLETHDIHSWVRDCLADAGIVIPIAS